MYTILYYIIINNISNCLYWRSRKSLYGPGGRGGREWGWEGVLRILLILILFIDIFIFYLILFIDIYSAC